MVTKPRIAHSANGKTITVPIPVSTHSGIIVVAMGTEVEVFKVADWQHTPTEEPCSRS